MPGCDYANARIGAMRGRRLGQKGILELLAQPDLEARLDYLVKKTAYGEAVAAHAARGPDALRGAERGLRTRLVDDLLRIDHFLRGERVRSLLHAVLAFEDGWTLKTILRGIAKGEAPERILLLVAPTPVLDDAALEQLVRQKQVKGVIDLLATWRIAYAAPLLEAFERYATEGDLFTLEAALDGFLFAQALAAARKHGGEDGRILRAFMEAQIDLANAATLLKLAGGASAEEFFIPGGRRMTRRRYRQLSTLGERELEEALARRGRLHLGRRLVTVGERGEPSDVDRVFQDALRALMRTMARVHPHSIAVSLSFALDHQAEVRQIRLVLRGAEFGLPAGQLAALLEA